MIKQVVLDSKWSPLTSIQLYKFESLRIWSEIWLYLFLCIILWRNSGNKVGLKAYIFDLRWPQEKKLSTIQQNRIIEVCYHQKARL